MLPVKILLRYLLATLFVGAGINHFWHTPFYVAMMPDYLPWHEPLVYLSGTAEIVLGLLLYTRRYSRLAAWGIIALLVAVFPANLQMALHPGLYPQFSAWGLWLRLPLQLPLLAWAWWYTRKTDASP